MFTIYAASAGSGKTFTLTKEFLKLALADHPDPQEQEGPWKFSPYYFQHILAVTFTNDAAHEMKKRILDTLLDLKKYNDLDPARQKKVKALRELLLVEITDSVTGESIGEAELQKRAALTFQVLLHQYGRLSVSTIDSFTQRVVSAFTEELGIPYNFEVSLESDVLVAAGVEQLLSKVGQAEFNQLTLVLEELVAELADQGKSWKSLQTELLSVGKKILDDKHRDALKKLEDLSTADFWEIRKKIRDYCACQDTEYRRLGKVAVELIEEKAALAIADFSYGANGAAGFLQKIRDGHKTFAEGISSRLYSVVRREQNWLKAKVALPILSSFEAIESELEVVGRELIQLHESQIQKYTLCLEIDKHLHKLALLKQLSDEVKSIEDHTGQIHISRFNQSILNIVLEEPIPFLYERLGEKFHHILIDEFQDTSQLQWLNFMPLIDNSLSSDYYNLVVGDAKQSIYRFRGGEMEQLVYLHEGKDLTPMLPAGNEINWNVGDRLLTIKDKLYPQVLDFNRRSCKEIIDFNNDILKHILANQVPAEWEVTPRIYSAYIQKAPDNPACGGHVQIDFLDNEKPSTPEFILRQISECLADGYEYKDIAILCRKNKHARELADTLTATGIRVISADSLLVSASPVVNLIIAFLRVLNTPDQPLAKYEAAYLFLKEIQGQVPEEKVNTRIRQMVEAPDMRAFWRWVREKELERIAELPKEAEEKELNSFQMQKASLFESCEELIARFKLFDKPDQSAYLFRFLDYVQDFSTRKSGHLSDFLLDWEQQKFKLCVSSPEGANAVRIQTIHKSKGLEFPVVLLPYANWSFKNNLWDEIWGDLESMEAEELTLVSVDDQPSRSLKVAPFSVSQRLAATHLKEAYEKETEQTFLDNLNLLYVALTRPVERVYISMETKLSKKGEVTGLKDTVGVFFSDYVNACEGTHVLRQGKPRVKANQKEETGKVVITGVITKDRRGSMRLRRQKDRLSELDSFALQKDWGNKAHIVMREINTPEDVPVVIDRMQKRGLLDETQVVRMQEAINRILSKEEMKPYFEMPAEFLSEREILMPNGEVIRPDRVVIRPDQTVAILDYKTGQARDSHKEQIKKYARRYREMGYKHIEGWIVYLESGELVQVS